MMIKLKNMLFEEKYYEFIRFGGLSPVNQKKSYKNDSFHSAPAKKGIYAFPFDQIEPFLMGGMEYSKDKYEYVKDEKGNKIKMYKKNEDGELVLTDYIKKRFKDSISGFFDSDLRFEKSGYTEEHIFDKNKNHVNSYLIKLKKPKKFKYSGNIWHHLTDKVRDSDIIKKNKEWILTNIDVYIKALNKEKAEQKNMLDKKGYKNSKDHFEVFIERIP